jgi:hypothetical protein
MCDDFGWHRDGPERERAWKLFRIAVIQAFNSTVGSNADDLASWHRICRCLRITPMPNGLRNARQVSHSSRPHGSGCSAGLTSE